MEYYQFIFDSITEAEKEMLIALLSDIGFTGFEEEEDKLKAFINKDDFNVEAFESIISNLSIAYTKSGIAEINWNAVWESGFEPITVHYPGTEKPFAHVRAVFHEKDMQSDYDIEITPKMSFGTGHHATTYLMMEQMSQLNLHKERVIDFGTGTGVLAILAEKMGAENIIAIDNDDWSIENAKENIEKNNCEKITLVKAETIQTGFKASLILANINLNIILANLAALKQACLPGAIVLFSGILRQDETIILKAITDQNFEIINYHYKNDWLIIQAIMRIN